MHIFLRAQVNEYHHAIYGNQGELEGTADEVYQLNAFLLPFLWSSINPC